ncbi:MAG: hypothetical protein ACE5MK_04000 [Acidobacteriota bacterium]
MGSRIRFKVYYQLYVGGPLTAQELAKSLDLVYTSVCNRLKMDHHLFRKEQGPSRRGPHLWHARQDALVVIQEEALEEAQKTQAKANHKRGSAGG